ncbi:MAG: hypothetical protein L6Q71_10025, partial [Planctomycetes bacterium]|nr:hypothetical protein [Planctomycetota bacterium]
LELPVRRGRQARCATRQGNVGEKTEKTSAECEPLTVEAKTKKLLCHVVRYERRNRRETKKTSIKMAEAIDAAWLRKKTAAKTKMCHGKRKKITAETSLSAQYPLKHWRPGVFLCKRRKFLRKISQFGPLRGARPA